MGWVVNATPRPLYPREKEPVSTAQEGGWDPGPVWTGTKKLVPHQDSIPEQSIPKRFAIPTELSRPNLKWVNLEVENTGNVKRNRRR